MAEEMDKDREMQERVMAYRMLDSKLKGMAQQREALAAKIMEVQSTMVSVDDIVKSKGEILFSVGSDAYVRGSLKDDKNVVVEVGAGVALEKSVGDAKVSLEARLKELEDAFSNLQNEIVRVSSIMGEIQAHLEG